MRPKLFLKACSLSLALIGTAAFVTAVAVPDYAYAKNGNGGGNGNSNGGGNGNGNGKGNGQGAGKSDTGTKSGKVQRSGKNKFSLEKLFQPKKATKVKPQRVKPKVVKSAKVKPQKAKPQKIKKTSIPKNVSVKPVKKPHGNKMAALLGVHPSELGALNAANANENALKNAAPSSRVGRIAAYKEAVLNGQALEQDLANAKELLEGLAEPSRPTSEVTESLEVALADAEAKANAVDELKEDLADAGGSAPNIEAAIATAEEELAAAQSEVDDLAAEKAAADIYEETASEVANLEEQLKNQPELEITALEDAANKPVTPEVEAAVKKLLGL